jgi:predicted short-subunit dehydrogenase-like oxidoreductase (DUF2520 family)
MSKDEPFIFSIIGLGRVGVTLLQALDSIGGICSGVVSSSLKDVSVPSGQKIKISRSVSDLDAGEYCFIAVPDDAIQSVTHKLTSNHTINSAKVVSHLSGTKSSKILSELSIPVASCHPMNTFKLGAQSNIFNNILVSIEGDKRAVELLIPLMKRIGAHPREVTQSDKERLHIAGVIVSNFMSALVFYAAQVVSVVDPDPVNFIRREFGPLMEQTLRNILDEGYPSALTGPASRGDKDTTLSHLQLLINNNINDKVYLELTELIIRYSSQKQ